MLWLESGFLTAVVAETCLFPILLGVWLIVSSRYAKAVEPLVARLITSRSPDEIMENFEELKAIMTSLLESDDIDVRDNLIIAFYALLEIAKVQAGNILEIRSQVAGLENQIKR